MTEFCYLQFDLSDRSPIGSFNPGADNDYFVHQSDIYAEGFRSLAEGEAVESVLRSGLNVNK